MRKTTLCFSLVMAVLGLAVVSHAQTVDVLYNFCSQQNCKDGANPMADLAVDPSGNLWGTTRAGGTGTACNGGCGTIFELTASSKFTTLVQAYSFQGGSGDGAFPEAGLVFDSQTQTFYGTTSAGGTGCSGGCGTIFEFVPSNAAEHVLHFFGGNGDGATPKAELLMDSSQNFYGTTSAGVSTSNCNAGCGTVFRINPLANSYDVLYRFNGSAKTADGADPVAGLVFDSKQNLWGTAQKGGAKNFGTVFELAAPSYTSLAFAHSIKGPPNGAYPAAAMTFDKNVGGPLGTLYGTTSAGGSKACSGGCGIVFELEISGHVDKIIYKFTGSGSTKSGSAPVGRLALDDIQGDKRAGHLYGTASLGGSNTGACPAAGCGTLFEICPPTISCTIQGGPTYPREATVFHFNGTEGANPTAGVLLDVQGLNELLFGEEPGEYGSGPLTGKGACPTNCIGTGTNGGQNGKGVVVGVKP